MEYTIRRISPGSVFKISFVLYGLLGFFVAFLYGLLFLGLAALGASSMGSEMRGLLPLTGGLGAIAVFFGGMAMAVAYALVSAAITSILAMVYNLLAGWIGGFRVVLDYRWAAPGPSPAASLSAHPSPAPSPPAPSPPASAPPDSPAVPSDPSQTSHLPGPQDQLREDRDAQNVSNPEERP